MTNEERAEILRLGSMTDAQIRRENRARARDRAEAEALRARRAERNWVPEDPFEAMDMLTAARGHVIGKDRFHTGGAWADADRASRDAAKVLDGAYRRAGMDR
ncbi:MAG: hypothetical protein GY769_17585 [bacterium]|nr:hypothetical protein [bacterium]